MPSLGVVLTVFKRPYSLAEQLTAIRAQSVSAQQVTCFVQEPSLELSHEIHCAGFDRVVECTPNSFYHFRFAVAMTMQTDFVAILDDDAIPGERWFENCLQTFAKTPGILGTHGIKMRSFDRYTDRQRLGWIEPSRDTVEVDYVGQSWFLRPKWIRYLFSERLFNDRNGEDIELGARAWRLGGIRSFCPPHPPGQPEWWGCRDPRLNADQNASHRRRGWGSERLKILLKEHRAGWQPLCQRTAADADLSVPEPINQRSARLAAISDASERRSHGNPAQSIAQGVASTATNWAVGVTTAPRSVATLAQSLTSLAAAGWDTPRLFAEPGTIIPPAFEHLPITLRDQTLGAFPNWYLGLAELVMRAPAADAYLMCQDDVLFADGLRHYLEQADWQSLDAGVISVYCPSHYATDSDPGFHVENRGWQSWGALAYLLPAASARALIGDRRVIEHRLGGPADGLRNIDSVVGRWCKSVGKNYVVHAPSLAQHIGDTSTIWRDARNGSRRQADRFLERVSLEELNSKSPAAPIASSPSSLESAGASPFSQQAWRFITALTRHAADGLRKSSQEQLNHRLAICQNCPAFTGDRCQECSCRCNERQVFLNKLAWRSESCPLGNW